MAAVRPCESPLCLGKWKTRFPAYSLLKLSLYSQSRLTINAKKAFRGFYSTDQEWVETDTCCRRKNGYDTNYSLKWNTTKQKADLNVSFLQEPCASLRCLFLPQTCFLYSLYTSPSPLLVAPCPCVPAPCLCVRATYVWAGPCFRTSHLPLCTSPVLALSTIYRIVACRLAVR